MSETAVPQAGTDAASPAGDAGVLNGRYRVAFNEPLPVLDQPFARAYAAYDEGTEHEALYALACDPAVPMRETLLEPLRTLVNPHLLRIVTHGLVGGPDAGATSQVVVFEFPAGGRLVPNLKEPFKAWSEEEVLQRVLPVALEGLSALHGLDFTHRAVRPDNLFFVDSGRSRLVLGECVVSPPGAAQPAVFEPVDRAMANPFGRGPGTPACDYYALGVTLLALLTGQMPQRGRADDEVNFARLTHGSYRLLVGDARLSRGTADLLAGLLCDASDSRWGADEARRWLDKKRTLAPPAPIRRRALQPYRFMERDFFEPRALAYAFAENWDDARRVIRNGRLQTWLERSLNDPKAAAAVDSGIAQADGKKGVKRLSEDELLARICVVLDPEGPVRCRRFAAIVDGFGPVLAEAVRQDNEDVVQAVSQTIASALPVRAIEAQKGAHSKIANLMGPFLRMDALLREPGLGFGIERCLYELNPGLSCRSPLLAKRSVMNVGQLLSALEDLAGSARGDVNPVDRHVAAFIGSRLSIRDAGGGATPQGLPGMRLERLAGLRLLALAQVRDRKESTEPLGPLPKLCGLMAKRLAPAIGGFRSRRLRETVQHRLATTAARGSLADLLNLLLDPSLVKQDAVGFAMASRELRAILAERHDMETGGARRRAAAMQMGRQVSAALGYFGLIASLAYTIAGWVP